jgi:hypothetical protein
MSSRTITDTTVHYADLEELGPTVLRAEGWVQFKSGLRIHSPESEKEPRATRDLWARIETWEMLEWVSQEEAAVLLGISRERLDALVALAPSGLPEGPTDISDPESSRRHFRWNRAGVHKWFGALGNHQQSRPRRPQAQTVRAPATPTKPPKIGGRNKSIRTRLKERDGS